MLTSKGTVLLLSTYPLVAPKHGGEIRLLNIKRAYERAGWRVISIAIYPEESYSNATIGPNDIKFPLNSRYRLFNGRSIPLVTDIVSGNFAVNLDGALPQVLDRVPTHIDAIHVEQPWLWPLVQAVRGRSHSSAVVVYGSQNIESPLKRGILHDWKVAGFEEAVEAVDRLEREAAQQSDLTIAVTQEEVDVFSSWGIKNVELLPNGIEPWQTDDDNLAQWKQKLPRHPWLLYVASAHPPNFTGLTQIFGESLGCFPPTSKLVVAGSVSEHVRQVMSKSKWPALNLSRLQLLNILSDRDLAAVKALAHGFVLPIPFGGGSNIKTAEALYSGSYVVGTPNAFRGFESFTRLPEVVVGKSPKEFQQAIRDVLSLSRATPSQDGREERQRLRWDVCLAPLPLLVESLKREKNRL